MHGHLKDHKCEDCGKNFSHEHHLQGHIKGVHKKLKDHTCVEDVTRESNESKVMTSINYEANEIGDMTMKLEEDLACPECRFVFSTGENLKIHMQNGHSMLKSPENNEGSKEQNDNQET